MLRLLFLSASHNASLSHISVPRQIRPAFELQFVAYHPLISTFLHPAYNFYNYLEAIVKAVAGILQRQFLSQSSRQA